MKMQKLATLACVLALVVGVSGCVGVAVVAGAGAGATAVAYKLGELVATTDHPTMVVSAAADQGLAELKLPVVSKTTSELTVTVLSRDADDASITITLKSVSATQTQIHIRVGMLGDETRSVRILNAILDHLPKPVTPAKG